MKNIILFTLILLVLAACQSPGAMPTAVVETPSLPTPAPMEDMEGSEWILSSINGQAPVQGTFITLQFKDGIAGGTSGCNSYGGQYSIEGNRLTISEIASTLMACVEPEGVMEQEQAYLQALTELTGTPGAPVRISGDQLELSNSAGQPVMSYTRKQQFDMDPAELVGTAWQLENVDGQKPAWEMTLVMVSADRFSGFAGCRHMVGTYSAEGDNIRFTSMAMLGEDCSSNQVLTTAEGDYTTLLSNTTDYRIEPERLVLLQSSGKTISFSATARVDAESLAGTSWKLAGVIAPAGDPDFPMNTVTPLWPGSEITAAFDETQISGSAGCNQYFAGYTLEGQTIKVDPPGATKMYCEQPEGLMTQESNYLETLSNATSVQRFPGQLWITTTSGLALFFVEV
jgi:heat shock protein HslJ